MSRSKRGIDDFSRRTLMPAPSAIRPWITYFLHRKHHRPQERKHEHGNSEDERDYTHPPLLELCRRVGEEKHCGEQNSIREVLTGNTPGTAGLPLAFGSFGRRLGGFTAPSHLVKVGHKRMGISIWIACCVPCIVNKPALRSNALNSFISRLLCRVHAADSNEHQAVLSVASAIRMAATGSTHCFFSCGSRFGEPAGSDRMFMP